MPINSSSSGGSTFTSKVIGKPSCPLRARLPYPYRHYKLPQHERHLQRYRPQSRRISTSCRPMFTIAKISPTTVSLTSSSCSPTIFCSFLYSFFSNTDPRFRRMIEWAKSKPTSPQTRDESPGSTMSIPPISAYRPPSCDSSSRMLPRPSLLRTPKVLSSMRYLPLTKIPRVLDGISWTLDSQQVEEQRRALPTAQIHYT
ncbi:hypothetical protein EV421DRAFT_354638 [Armillaria borealis]|uniref:Uncharacterized protein n=1 Tax=Armillaria borealis TaxID=47425 RepID=A0AA39IUD1_9AGAR|nr:hypothetical protein EV421DRAFT_354638 [Armillaria borealis]